MTKFTLYTTLVLIITSCGCRDTQCPITDFGIYDDHYPNNSLVFENGFGDSVYVELEEGGFVADKIKTNGLGGCMPCFSDYEQEGIIEGNDMKFVLEHDVLFSGPSSGEIEFSELAVRFDKYHISFNTENDTENTPKLFNGTMVPVLGGYELRENENITNCFVGVLNIETEIDTLFYSKDVGVVAFNLQDTTWKRVF